MTDPDALADQARMLSVRVPELTKSVVELTTAVAHLSSRTSRNERTTIMVVFGLALDVVLSVAVGVGLFQGWSTDTRLEAAIAREAATRQDGLCPLYALIIGSYNPNSRPAGEQRDQYNNAFDVMRKAYTTLDCTEPLVPPAIPR